MIQPVVEIVDTLIVGAGPTGMTAAIALTLTGSNVMVVDKHAQGLEFSRAILINSDSLRIFESLGLKARIQAQGIALQGIEIFDGNDSLIDAWFAPPAAGQGWSLPVNLAQLETEACLAQRLADLDVRIERPWALTRLMQDQEGVSATLTHSVDASQTREIHARYLVGSDGFHSTTRELLGISYPCISLPHPILAVDIGIERWPFRAGLVVRRQHQGMVLVIRLNRQRARFVVTDPSAGQWAERWLGARKIIWSSEFHMSFAVAERYGIGRVWLAGDAAHVHSPIGGRGMNMGIADGAALAEAITRQEFAPYETERHAVAKAWVERNLKIARVMTSQGRAAQMTRKGIFLALRLGGLIAPQRIAKALLKNLANVQFSAPAA